jgi:lysozyme
MKSTMPTFINKGNLKAAASQFDRWIYENGLKISALVNRRAKERELFSKIANAQSHQWF